MKLLSTQKLSILKSFNESSLGANSLEFEEFKSSRFDAEENVPSIKIKVKGTDYYFSITKTSKYVNFEFFPNHADSFSPEESKWFNKEEFTWFKLFEEINSWKNAVISEAEADNEISLLMQQITFDTKETDIRFNPDEIKLLEQKLFNFSEYLATIPLVPNQLEELLNSVNQLKEKIKDTKKVDWKNLFIGTFISIIIQLSVTQENAKLIWEGIKNFVFNQHLLP